MQEPNILPATEAARQKACTAQAIYNAVARGDLNGLRMGAHHLVFRDEKYAAYRVQETGGRLHKQYVWKQAVRRKRG